MDVFPATPNLDVLLSRPVVLKMMGAAGGLKGLSSLNGMKLKFLGIDVKKAEAAAASNGDPAGDLAKASEKVCGGFIIESPFLATLFNGDVPEAVGSEPLVVRKAVDVLGNKCALAAKVDASGGRRDGGYGTELAEMVRADVAKAKDKGKVDAGHVKALDAVATREDKTKRGGKQARSDAKRAREEAEEGLDAVALVLQEYMCKTGAEDLGRSRREREEALLRREDVRDAIRIKDAQMQRSRQKKEDRARQGNDLSAGASGNLSGAAEHLFAASSGYLVSTFGVCRVAYGAEGDLYANMTAALR